MLKTKKHLLYGAFFSLILGCTPTSSNLRTNLKPVSDPNLPGVTIYVEREMRDKEAHFHLDEAGILTRTFVQPKERPRKVFLDYMVGKTRVILSMETQTEPDSVTTELVISKIDGSTTKTLHYLFSRSTKVNERNVGYFQVMDRQPDSIRLRFHPIIAPTESEVINRIIDVSQKVSAHFHEHYYDYPNAKGFMDEKLADQLTLLLQTDLLHLTDKWAYQASTILRAVALPNSSK